MPLTANQPFLDWGRRDTLRRTPAGAGFRCRGCTKSTQRRASALQSYGDGVPFIGTRRNTRGFSSVRCPVPRSTVCGLTQMAPLPKSGCRRPGVCRFFHLARIVQFMQTNAAFQSLAMVDRRAFVRAVRGSVHCFAMLAGVLSSIGTTNEVESPSEVIAATEYAQTHEDVGSRLRRARSSHCMMRILAPSALPTFAGRVSTSTAYATARSRLSLGLSIPLRC